MTSIAGFNVRKPKPLPEKNVYLIDGVAGVGKTTLVATVGKGNKILVLDFEGGSVSYSSPYYETISDGTELDNIDIISFPLYGEGGINQAAQLSLRVGQIFDHLLSGKNAEGYAVVVVDSLTEFQRRFVSTHGSPDPRKSYGDWIDSIYNIFKKANALTEQGLCEIVFTSRPKVIADEISGKDIVRSDISPGAWSVISGLVDVAGLYTLKTTLSGQTTRIFDTTHDQRYAAKERAGVREIENPSLRQILDAVSQVPKDNGIATVVPPQPVKIPKSSRFGGK